MGGGVALGTEVVGSAHQALSEVTLPDAVYHDPGRQGMAWPSQPEGQLLTVVVAIGFPEHLGRDGVMPEGPGQTGVDEVFLACRLPAVQKVGFRNQLRLHSTQHRG